MGSPVSPVHLVSLRPLTFCLGPETSISRVHGISVGFHLADRWPGKLHHYLTGVTGLVLLLNWNLVTASSLKETTCSVSIGEPPLGCHRHFCCSATGLLLLQLSSLKLYRCLTAMSLAAATAISQLQSGLTADCNRFTVSWVVIFTCQHSIWLTVLTV